VARTLPENVDSGPPEAPVRRHRTRVLAGGLLVVVLVVVGIIVFSAGGSSSTSPVAEQQLASVQRVCERWSGSSAPSLDASSASFACTNLANWMTEQLRTGRMTASMMWDSPSAFGSTCRHWLATETQSSVSGTTSPEWCDEMVSWMEQHIGNWDDWMMHGTMMGS
jgi:hypothetical protein